ncbi:MAG TPA: DEAD/DEAH box helicase [Methanomicrobiales archaeon]|nr:DEAD/DEAH box helicase [Methanomicrobiales archaeon]
MRVVVHPQRGYYRLFFLDGNEVTLVGQVDLVRTTKGFRPKDYLARKPGSRHGRTIPTKELIATLRQSEVRLTRKDEQWEAFLADLQIPWSLLPLCRTCLLEDRVTLLDPKTSVAFGKESVCMDCARKEVRRELGYFTKFGKISYAYIENLLAAYRDLDRVLSALQPEGMDLSRTLFDRIEAHPVTETAHISDLPLPPEFRAASGIGRLMPVQHLAVGAGLLSGSDLLVVSATASGKTFIGEMAGMKNLLEGRGRFLFLVPLVALANQKHERFAERYGKLARVSLFTGRNRLNLPENRARGRQDPGAQVVVGTYEGLDHLLRCGRPFPNIGTVVIDEVQMLEDRERGHRLDGLIARLKYLAPQAQFLYLSATVGMPHILAEKLGARLVTYADRPVPLERYLLFVTRKDKIRYEKQLMEDEFAMKSSKGYRGQTIVFTNSRARCHVIAEALGKKAAPYHAGLTAQERRDVERRFADGKIAAVVTTAALGAGVDFPASQVIFDSLAMGIEWLTVQEFSQMAGRSGRPDYHDRGKVVILAEPGGVYRSETTGTEEEVAIRLLRGEMEEVAPSYGTEESSEEFAAHAVVARGDGEAIRRITASMVGDMEEVLPDLVSHGLVHRKGGLLALSPLGRVMAEHFIGLSHLLELQRLAGEMDDPVAIIAELDCAERESRR